MTISTNPVPRILVVVYDEPIAEITAGMLRAAGYKCDVVWEHEETLRAMKRVKKYDYDLLFCHVAALEGEKEPLAWLLGSGKHTPLLAIAARSPEDVPKQIYKRCTFLRMPFEGEQVMELVGETLARRQNQSAVS
jgi:DNA-binding response OmpR family regulator